MLDRTDLVVPGRPGGDGHGAQVQVVSDGVLQLMVRRSLLEPGRQVRAQVTRQRAWGRTGQMAVRQEAQLSPESGAAH